MVCTGSYVKKSEAESLEGTAPYLWESGQFMKHYLMATMVIIGIIMSVACIGCCVVSISFYTLNKNLGMTELGSAIFRRSNRR